MSDSETALEHLRVIRSLMEKATVYRTVTVPTALAGGFTALITSTFLFLAEPSSTAVITLWLLVFLLVNAFHHGLIWKTSRKQNELYPSAGLRMALKAIAPAIATGGILGLALGYGPSGDLVAAALIWITFYGLALMATSGFSPRSLRVLGLLFTVTGSLFLAVHWWLPQGFLPLSLSPPQTNALFMGLSFGVYHLVYGLCARSWQRAAPSPREA